MPAEHSINNRFVAAQLWQYFQTVCTVEREARSYELNDLWRAIAFFSTIFDGMSWEEIKRRRQHPDFCSLHEEWWYQGAAKYESLRNERPRF